MEEHFEIFDENGLSSGLKARSLVHRDGDWHRAVNVFLFRTDGQLIIQRRHANKDVWPNAWDMSAAEHLKPGEDFLTGAIRGLEEELGLTDVSLEPWGEPTAFRLDLPELGIKDHEIQMSYKGMTDSALTLQVDEVSDARAITLDELSHAMQSTPDAYTPWFRERAIALELFSLTSQPGNT